MTRVHSTSNKKFRTYPDLVAPSHQSLVLEGEKTIPDLFGIVRNTSSENYGYFEESLVGIQYGIDQ